MILHKMVGNFGFALYTNPLFFIIQHLNLEISIKNWASFAIILEKGKIGFMFNQKYIGQ